MPIYWGTAPSVFEALLAAASLYLLYLMAGGVPSAEVCNSPDPEMIGICH